MAIDTHRHGRAFHHEVGEIGASCGLPYEDTRSIVFRLFAAGSEDKAKVLGMSPKALYAFVINNVDRLKDDFRAAMAAELDLRTSEDKISEKDFHFPHEWVCTFDAKAKVQGECEKNVYKGYPVSARPRSTGEIKFEKWCEQTKRVEWFYRNGDKGDEYFSIVYKDNAGRQKLFYPDYILSVGGVTWIVEVKGGFNASEKSENIDIFAPKKSMALKAYSAKHRLRGGFVCYAESEDELFLSEDGFSEDIHDPCWKLLNDVVGKD